MPSANEQAARSLKVAATYEDVRLLAAEVGAFCAEYGVGSVAMADIELAVVEAANNVVLHGYCATGEGSLDMMLESDSASVTVTLRDRGIPMPANLLNDEAEMPAFDMERGRGIALIQCCVDRLDYESSEGLNTLRMVKLLPQG